MGDTPCQPSLGKPGGDPKKAVGETPSPSRLLSREFEGVEWSWPPREQLARRAARPERAGEACSATGTTRRTADSACEWCVLAESLAQPERGGSRSSVHFSARLLLAMLTQQSAASRATRDGRGWQHWWLVIAGGGTVSQSGAAQAASLHFSARLLPARATQLSAARRAMRRSRSAAPPTVCRRLVLAGRGTGRLRRMSGAAQAASLHLFSTPGTRLLPVWATA